MDLTVFACGRLVQCFMVTEMNVTY